MIVVLHYQLWQHGVVNFPMYYLGMRIFFRIAQNHKAKAYENFIKLVIQVPLAKMFQRVCATPILRWPLCGVLNCNFIFSFCYDLNQVRILCAALPNACLESWSQQKLLWVSPALDDNHRNWTSEKRQINLEQLDTKHSQYYTNYGNHQELLYGV